MQQPSWWRQTPREIKRFTAILIPFGSVLFVLGIVADFRNWWDGHDFLLNVISSITGVCFGGPLAVVLFNRLSHTQNEARQTAQTRQLAAEESAAFEEILLSFFSSPDLDDLTAKTDDLLDRANTLYQMRLNDPAHDPALADFIDHLNTLLVPSPSQRPITNLRSLSRRSHERTAATKWRTQITDSWLILHNQIRRALPTGDRIPQATATAGQLTCQQLLKGARNPWGENGSPTGFPPMRYFLQDLSALCEAATALRAAYC